MFLVDGKPVSRLAVVLERLEIGDDPFERETVYRYYGLWALYAHITNDTRKGENCSKLTFWVGIRDFAEKAHQQNFFVEMKRDGELVAHSKRAQGSFPYNHYRRVEVHLYHPHEQKYGYNAIPFAESEWARDGDYEITITGAFSIRWQSTAKVCGRRLTGPSGPVTNFRPVSSSNRSNSMITVAPVFDLKSS